MELQVYINVIITIQFSADTFQATCSLGKGKP